MEKNAVKALLCTALSLSVLAGCGNSNITETEQNTQIQDETVVTETIETEESEQDTPKTVVKHAFGETVIEGIPERIVTLGWENQDTPLALGVVPVGVSAANYGLVTEHKLHVWTDEAFQALGEENPVVFNDVDGYDYEAISDAEPDVILAAYSGMTQEEYDLLSEIAPVVTYTDAPWQTTWRDQTIINATGMGMKEAGEAKVAETEALIQEKLNQYLDLAGTNTAFLWISPDDFSTFYAYLPTDPRCAFLEDLGLKIPDSILNLAENASDFSVTLSRENANLLSDVELIIVYGDESLLEALQADQLMSSIPAIRDGAVVLLDNTSAMAAATTPSILSIPAEIDEYLALLNEAHSKIQ